MDVATDGARGKVRCGRNGVGGESGMPSLLPRGKRLCIEPLGGQICDFSSWRSSSTGFVWSDIVALQSVLQYTNARSPGSRWIWIPRGE